jgi:hypothetical protein
MNMKVTSVSFFTIPILVLIGLFTFTSPGSGQVLKTYQGSNVGGGGQGTVYCPNYQLMGPEGGQKGVTLLGLILTAIRA